jgi:hypothetical protein
MKCIFCRSEENLTDEHVFSAFMGGELEVRNGSCKTCNGKFAVDEGAIKTATIPLLNLLQIENRYGVVPNAPLNAIIRGMDDLKSLPAFMDGAGEIKLKSVVKESVTDEGRRLRRGFFLTKEEGDKFVQRARSKGLQVIPRDVPAEIVIEAEYKSKITMQFAFSAEARRVAAKTALAAVAFEYGPDFALAACFDVIREARKATGDRDLRVWIFANEGLMGAHLRTAHQHSVMCYLSAGMRKGWALVAFFGSLTYLVELTADYFGPDSKMFSIFYDAASKARINPIVLADEMTLIGHVLSPATKFEDRDAVDQQWYHVISAFCAEKGIIVDRIGVAKPEDIAADD